MTEADIEIILQTAKEGYPEARPRIISDNGPQFIAKEFARISGMTHVRTSPYLLNRTARSNGNFRIAALHSRPGAVWKLGRRPPGSLQWSLW
jgi:hypothetical protein